MLIGKIYSLKSSFFDGNFVFSYTIQYKNFDEHLPEVGACAVKTRGQESPRVGHSELYIHRTLPPYPEIEAKNEKSASGFPRNGKRGQKTKTKHARKNEPKLTKKRVLRSY